MKSPGGAETFPVRPGFLLGHQGGWDEVLLVVGPLLVVGLLLWLANRRVSAQLEQTKGEAGGGAPEAKTVRDGQHPKQATKDRGQPGL